MDSARRVPRIAAAVLAALGLVPVANLAGGQAFVPWWSAAVREWLLVGGAMLLVALGLARLLGRRVDRWAARLEALALAPPPRAFAALVAGGVFALAVVFAIYCFAGAPFVQDEMAQRFHARVLLTGHLFARGEAHPEFFSITGVLDRGGHWYSMYPIGGPALLAAGMALHVTWLVNPLLTALTAWMVYRFAAAAFGEGPARAGALLFAASPFVLIMGASEMNHAGAMAPIRPLDATAVAVVVRLFQVWIAARDRTRAASLALQVAVGAVPVACLLYVNARTTGHPLLFAYDALYGPGQRLGFHLDPYGVPYTPARALVLTSANLMRLDRYLFEWPLPGLVPILVALLALRRPTRWDLLLLGLLGAVVGAYGLYWAADSFFAGPRFLYTAVPAFVVFAARSPGLVAARLPPGLLRRAALLVVPLCVGYAWLTPTGVSSVRMRAYYYHEGRTKLKTDIASQVRAADLGNALVLVHEGWRGRLEARLRALGLTPGDAGRLLTSADACQIQTALDVEEARPSGDTAGWRDRLLATTRPHTPLHAVPGLQADQAIFAAEGAVLTDTCRRELIADVAGTTPYAPFLALATFEADGSLGGPVVFARDLGERNALLRARFPERAWRRYRPRRGLDDTTAAFIPY